MLDTNVALFRLGFVCGRGRGWVAFEAGFCTSRGGNYINPSSMGLLDCEPAVSWTAVGGAKQSACGCFYRGDPVRWVADTLSLGGAVNMPFLGHGLLLLVTMLFFPEVSVVTALSARRWLPFQEKSMYRDRKTERERP